MIAAGCNSTSNTAARETQSISNLPTCESPEGWVVLLFDISETGQPMNIKVLDSNSEGRLDKEAVRALEKWKYKPKIVDREAKYWLQPEMAIAKSIGYSKKQLKRIELLVWEHQDELISAWQRHFKD